ncbi:MAG: 6-phosphogluconolactonase [Solirubrobacteraceae bacterium]
MSIDIQVVKDPAQACARMLGAAAASGGELVLTGGSTPRRAYELAAGAAPGDWAGASLWFTDERCVAPDSELSNFQMVKAALLDPLGEAGVSVRKCRRIGGEHGHEQAAAEYQRELAQAGQDAGGLAFELVLIGVGPDSHICSMFPGQASLQERARLAVGVPMAGLEPFVPRVTLTFAALRRARRVLVLATGTAKADAICASFAQDAVPTPEHPASLLREYVGEITVLLDEQAASRL